MGKNRVKGETDIRIRTTKEEKEEFVRLAETRGVCLTRFIKEQCLTEKRDGIYNKEVQQILYNISDLLFYQVEEHCEDKKFINTCKAEVTALWQNLR